MSKTILTIDDSASIRQMVVMTLAAAGHEVIEAINGADGYTKATTNTVHAVITDLNMPVLNGIEFIRKYRQHPSSKGVPIILLTTESDEELKRQASATGWIVKPFKQDQLLAVIKKVTGA
jgi:two-component system, chemotaxis family, chemotaxis protein CheY